MKTSIFILAFLGVVLVGFLADLFAPDTPAGRTLVFAISMTAFYPLVRLLGSGRVVAWRYFAGVAAGAPGIWTIAVLRRNGTLTEDTNQLMGFIVFALATACLLYAGWSAIWRRNPDS